MDHAASYPDQRTNAICILATGGVVDHQIKIGTAVDGKGRIFHGDDPGSRMLRSKSGLVATLGSARKAPFTPKQSVRIQTVYGFPLYWDG